jgi:hypothetical protein
MFVYVTIINIEEVSCGRCNMVRAKFFTPEEMLKIGRVIHEIDKARTL